MTKTGMWIAGILATIIISMAGSAFMELRSDISELDRRNHEAHEKLTVQIDGLKELINGGNVTVAETVKDVNINSRDIAKNTSQIEELRR